MATTKPELLRRAPSQARSKKTFEHILATAAELLDEVGWDGLTTNLVAKRAGVGLQSLYRYFPDKLSIVATIADRVIAKWNLWLDEYDANAPAEIAPGAFWVEGMRDFMSRLKNEPGGVALRRAMKSSPVLRAMDIEDTKRIAARMAQVGLRRGHCRSAEDAEARFLMLTETAAALIDLYFECDGPVAERLLDEGFAMQAAYIERNLIQRPHSEGEGSCET